MAVEDMNRITLKYPVEDNGETITTLSLTRPKSGHLRGLKILELAQMDVTQLTTLLPRITRPALSPTAIKDLDPVDLMQLASHVSGFFFTRDQIEAETKAWQDEVEDAVVLPSPEAGKAKG